MQGISAIQDMQVAAVHTPHSGIYTQRNRIWQTGQHYTQSRIRLEELEYVEEPCGGRLPDQTQTKQKIITYIANKISYQFTHLVSIVGGTVKHPLAQIGVPIINQTAR